MKLTKLVINFWKENLYLNWERSWLYEKDKKNGFKANNLVLSYN